MSTSAKILIGRWTTCHTPNPATSPVLLVHVPDEPGAYVDLSRYAYWLENGEGGVEGSAGG